MPIILLVIGFALIIYNYRALKRDGSINSKNDNLSISFQSILQDNKEGLNDYKFEIGLLRKDMAESLTELQEEIFDIKNSLNKLKNKKEMYDNNNELEKNYYSNENNIDDTQNFNEIDDNSTSNTVEEDSVIVEIDFSEKADSNKTHKIKMLLEEGLTEEEICHQLSVSKGEVLLVKGLFKR